MHLPGAPEIPVARCATLLVCCVVLAHGSYIWADTVHPLEPVNTASPRDTLRDFREAGRNIYAIIKIEGGARGDVSTRRKAADHVRRLLRCLDLSEQPAYRRDSVAKQSAVCLLEIFDRIELPADGEIPGAAEVEADEDLTRWRIPHTEIMLRRVADGPRQGEFLFSPETVADAPEFYERVKHLPYKAGASEGFHDWLLSEPGAPWLAWLVHRLPDGFRARYFGQAVWQWIGLVLTLLLGLLSMGAAYVIGRWRTQALSESSVLRRMLTLWAPLAALVVPPLVGFIVEDWLVISGSTLAVVNFGANIVFLIALMVVVMSLGNRVADVIIALPRVHPRGIDAQFIRIVCRVLSLVVAVIVFLEGGQYLGIPLTTLLAGAGVGGLTIALAAQDTLRNIFGSMMILLDKPFRVGERIVVKGYDGVVQEIGLRSTKLRLLTGHEATIPNDELARTDVENIGRRPHIRRRASLALPFDLTPHKCEEAVAIVRNILQNHEGMDEKLPPRVFLDEFNRDSLNLCIFYWYRPPNYWDFLAFSERVNLEIKRRFAEAGIPFALPSSKTILAQDDEHPVDLQAGKRDSVEEV